MVESRKSNQEDWLLIPFYTDPEASNYSKQVAKFGDFIDNAVTASGLRLAVIDDGSGLTRSALGNIPELLFTLKENQGKSFAVRKGLSRLLKEDSFAQHIVQYDGDGDQSYIDIPRVLSYTQQSTVRNADRPVLVIGDRYSEDLSIEPNPESIEYRQSILTFFGAIAGQLGFSNVRDWVSGARGFNRSYAKGLIEKGKSSRYGLESEQLVVASLIGGDVTTAPLRESRPRDPHTLTSKWLQNFDVYKFHGPELRAQGKSHVVDVVDTLLVKMENEVNAFGLDLNPVGEDTTIYFTRLGDRYTASIPWGHRAKIFQSQDSFQLLTANRY